MRRIRRRRLGNLSAKLSNFGSGTVSYAPQVSGALVAGGTLSWLRVEIQGNDFGIGAFSVTVPVSTAYPSGTPSRYPSSTPSSEPAAPSVTLSHSSGDSTIAAKTVDCVTDAEHRRNRFGGRLRARQICVRRFVPADVEVPISGTVDFGGGISDSPGGNIFLGARLSEISLVRSSETISALDDTWNPSQQGANPSERHTENGGLRIRRPGKNVTIRGNAPRNDGDRRTRSRADANAVRWPFDLAELHSPLKSQRTHRSMLDMLQKIYNAKAALLELEQVREPYDALRARASARIGERQDSWQRCSAHKAVRSSPRSSAHRPRPD